MQIVLSEAEIKEAICEYIVNHSSTAVIETPGQDPTPLGLELGVNTMQEPFIPEAKETKPAPVKRTRGPNKKSPVKTETPVEPAPVKEEVKEELLTDDPFALDETPVSEPVNGPGEELELETVDDGAIDDTASLFA